MKRSLFWLDTVESDFDSDYDPEDDKASNAEVYPLKKKLEIVKYSVCRDGSLRKFASVREKYKKVKENTLKSWRHRYQSKNETIFIFKL